ncbi:MAG: ABC transporter permease subunit [Verrucomicrobiales bacterium]|nr:ABC transporter permease subunit [Verrucomicrobiales bacterium]
MGVFDELKNRFPELQTTLAEHLFVLTLIPVALASCIAIPLAILVRSRPIPRSVALGVSGIVQTIPSLAMLAFLLPLFGIGKLPAVIALTLYAILPILQNAVTAMRELNAGVLEAADGIGFSTGQRLRMVELPLALPLIISGLRTATTICVGVATLSTFIGAGGLGDFINRGLSLNRMSLLLIGAGAAALLALMLDYILDSIGMAFRPGRKARHMSLRYAVCGVLAIFLAGLIFYPVTGQSNRTKEGASGVVRIGSKNFTEQIILGELMAQWIEMRTDLRAERYLNLGGTVICHQALTSGEIDLYVEYTGTALLTLLERQRDPSATPAEIVEEVRAAYGEKFDCAVLPPLSFENTYAITVRRPLAEQHGWKTITHLVPSAANLRGGFTAEFMERTDGLPGLSRAYGLTFGNLNDLGPELMYAAVAREEVDAIGAFSTDGRILEFDLQTLEDDRSFFPPYEAVPVVRREVLKRFPRMEQALRELAGTLDNAAMTRLNHAVDVRKQDPAEAVRRFLQTLSKE